MASDHIWLSQSLMSITNRRALTSDLAEADREGAAGAGRRNDTGEPLGPEFFPTTIWPTIHANSRDTAAGDLFYTGTHPIVSARFAALLRGFDMGESRLYPVAFLQKDRATPVKGEWFCINFGNTKTALDPEMSSGLFRPSSRREVWTIQKSSGAFAFTPAAREGGDLWIDPTLQQVLCLSGRLGDAMREHGIVKGFLDLDGEMAKGRIVAP